MPLQVKLEDIIAKLADDVKRLRYAIAAATVVETTASTSTDETVTINANADSGWQSLPSGPSLTITTGAGKIGVTVSGRIKIGGSNTNALGSISYQILDANNNVVVAPDLYRGVFVEYKGTGMGASAQSSFVYVHSGLAPGTYTVKTQYRYWDGPGSVTGTWTADFINRSLVAKGY